jgi:hypothetical protein
MCHVPYPSMLQLRQLVGNIAVTQRYRNVTTELIDLALLRSRLLFRHFAEMINFTVMRFVR